MKICQDHWHELRNAIRQRGLWGLVAPGGFLERQITEQELKANPAQTALDPLRATSLIISEQAMMALGTDCLSHNVCPLCEVEQNLGRGSSLEWIDTDADLMLEICRQRNMIGRDQ